MDAGAGRCPGLYYLAPLGWEMRASQARQLRKGVEVAVAGVEEQAVLLGERGDPEVAGRDGGALLAKLAEELGVVAGGVLVGVEPNSSGRWWIDSPSRRATMPGVLW